MYNPCAVVVHLDQRHRYLLDPPNNHITINPGIYNVTDLSAPFYALAPCYINFQVSYSDGCQGTIAAGQTRDCTVTYRAVSPEAIPINESTVIGPNVTLGLNCQTLSYATAHPEECGGPTKVVPCEGPDCGPQPPKLGCEDPAFVKDHPEYCVAFIPNEEIVPTESSNNTDTASNVKWLLNCRKISLKSFQ